MASVTADTGGLPGRVVFLVRLKPDSTERFLDAYERIRHFVAQGVPGHLKDQICQSTEDPDDWLITSEWQNIRQFLDWEASPGHRVLVQPLRDCIARASSLRFVVHQETC